MVDNRFFRIPTNFLTGDISYDNYIDGYGRYKVPQYEPSQYTGIGRDLGKNYIDIDIVPEGNAPKFEGGISRNVGDAEQIAKSLDTVYPEGQTKNIAKEVGNAASKSKLPHPIIRYGGEYLPGVADVLDIGFGMNKMFHPSNKLDPWLGLGQAGLGLAGLVTLPLGGSLGKAGIKALAKGIIKRTAMKDLGKTPARQLYRKTFQELSDERKIRKFYRQVSNALHNKARYTGSGVLDAYDLFKNPYKYEELVPNNDNEEETNNSQVNVPGDDIASTNTVAPNLVKIMNEQQNGRGNATVVGQQTHPDGVKGLIDDGHKKYGYYDRGSSQEAPLYNTNGSPVNKAGFADAMKRGGYSQEEIDYALKGFNGGVKELDEAIKSYNKTALPGQEIRIPQTQEEINNILTGQVDNQDNTEAEYLNELMNYYNNQRNNYNDYVDAINDLTARYGDRYRLDYNLRQGDLLPHGQPSVSDALAKRADLYKLAGDVNNKYDKMLVETLANYRMGRALGLPLGSDFASQDMIKNYIDIKKGDIDTYNKLALELTKLAAQSEEKAKDRENRLNIATMQVQAANDRANLTNNLKQQELALKEAEIQGRWDLAAELRDSINKTNIMLNATKIVGEAGIYGVEDPEALNYALEILGYKNKIKPASGNTSNSIEEKYKKYGGK